MAASICCWSKPARTRATSRPRCSPSSGSKRELGMQIPVMVSGTIETDGHDARRSDRGRVLCLHRARRPAVDRTELRHRPRVHDRPHPHAQHEMAPTRISCYPNAGLPNEERKYLETPESLAAAAREVRRPRLAEHRRRLLRHHARAHRGHRADGRRASARGRCPDEPRRDVLFRHRAGGGRETQPAADRRRAHQRHRLARCSRTWSPKRSGKRRPRSPAGRSATARTSSTSACRPPIATRCRTSRRSTKSSSARSKRR